MPYLIVLLVVVVIVMISCVNVVPQAHAYVVERLGGCLLYTSDAADD